MATGDGSAHCQQHSAIVTVGNSFCHETNWALPLGSLV
jgi:hypothetical protein